MYIEYDMGLSVTVYSGGLFFISYRISINVCYSFISILCCWLMVIFFSSLFPNFLQLYLPFKNCMQVIANDTTHNTLYYQHFLIWWSTNFLIGIAFKMILNLHIDLASSSTSIWILLHLWSSIRFISFYYYIFLCVFFCKRIHSIMMKCFLLFFCLLFAIMHLSIFFFSALSKIISISFSWEYFWKCCCCCIKYI